MNKLSEILTGFKSFSFPVEFDHVKTGTNTPFAEYTFETSDNFDADDVVFCPRALVELRVFMSDLDAALLTEIESFFRTNEISWSRSQPQYYEETGAFEVDYSFGCLDDTAGGI